MLLAELIDVARWLQWAKTKAAEKVDTAPKPYPRPGVERKPKAAADERPGDQPARVRAQSQRGKPRGIHSAYKECRPWLSALVQPRSTLFLTPKDQTAKVKVEVDDQVAKQKVREVSKDTTAKVKVEVNAARAEAKVKAVTQDRKVDVVANIDVADAKKRLEALKAAIKDQELSIRVRTTEADVKIDALKKRLDEVRSRVIDPATIKVDFDSAPALAEIAALQADIKRRNLAIEVTTKEAQTKIAVLREQMVAPLKALKLNADDKAAKAQIAALRGEIGKISTDLQIDTNAAKADIARLIEDVARKKADLRVELDAAQARLELDEFGKPIDVELKFHPDSAAARAEAETLRQELDDLKANVGLDTGAARAQLLSLKAEAASTEVEIKADADTAAAKAKLDAAARPRRATINADADTAGADGKMKALGGSAGIASGAITALIAAGAAIGPAIVPAAAAAAAAICRDRPAAALIGAGGIGVLVGRAEGCRRRVAGQHQGHRRGDRCGGEGRHGAGVDGQPGRVRAGCAAVGGGVAGEHSGQRGRGGSPGVPGYPGCAAGRQGRDRPGRCKGVEQAVARQAAAERTLQGALAQEEQAQHGLSLARQQAKRDIEALTNAVQDGQLNQRQASLDVQQTYDALVASQDSGSRLEREAAQLAYDRAVQRQKELAQDQAKLVDDQKTAQQNGVEGNPAVVAAKQQIEAAKARWPMLAGTPSRRPRRLRTPGWPAPGPSRRLSRAWLTPSTPGPSSSGRRRSRSRRRSSRWSTRSAR
jgi:hypothetical protein